MSGSGVIPIPMPPSSGPVSANSNKSNTIVLIVVILLIVAFLVFMFTKLNTQNKQIKELQTERTKRDKLLEAIAQQLNIHQNEKGEIEFIGGEADEGDDVDEEEERDVCDEKVCHRAQQRDVQQMMMPLFAEFIASPPATRVVPASTVDEESPVAETPAPAPSPAATATTTTTTSSVD